MSVMPLDTTEVLRASRQVCPRGQPLAVALGVATFVATSVPVASSAQVFQTLDNLPGFTAIDAQNGPKLNAAGTIVVGTSINPVVNIPCCDRIQATLWTTPTSPAGLGTLGGYNSSIARGFSADGAVVVGDVEERTINGTFSFQAFRWTAAGGMAGLGFLPGDTGSQAYAANADGSVIVGGSALGSKSQAFRWTASPGMVGLGFLPGETAARRYR
jgi:probable HAF family extracellular repeat protein